MPFCGYCGHQLTAQALAAGQCQSCFARVAVNGDVIAPGISSATHDAPTDPAPVKPPLPRRDPTWPLAGGTPGSRSPLARFSARLGIPSGALVGIAFFLTWITFTSTTCNKPGPIVTQSGWDMLTKPISPFNLGVLLLPVLVGAVVGVGLHLGVMTGAARAGRLATWNFVVAFVACVFFSLLVSQVIGNALVHALYAGFYLELLGLLGLLGAAIMQAQGTMRDPATLPPKTARRAMSGLSLLLALYPLAPLALLWIALSPAHEQLPPLGAGISWTLLASSVVALILGLIVGRNALRAGIGRGVARWGVLVSLGGLGVIAYVVGLLLVVTVINRVAHGS